MKVGNLQQFIRSLAAPLQQAGAAAKVVNDLEQTSQDLQPFAEWEVWQLGELLRQAKEYRDTGILPAPPAKRGGAKKAATPKAEPKVLIAEYAEKVRALRDRAAAPDAAREAVTAELTALNLGALSGPVLVGVAGELGHPLPKSTKKEKAAERLRRLVFGEPEPLTRSTRRGGGEPQQVDSALILGHVQKVRALEERAAAPESTWEELKDGLAKLSLDNLPKDALVEIARELNRPLSSGVTKPEAIDQIRRVVLERKELLESAIV